MPRSGRRWHDYWSKQTTPLHREDTERFYRLHAAELKLLFPRTPTRVLELGCGNGALFELLEFAKTEYTGCGLLADDDQRVHAHPP